jgi:hypothetical protein
VSKQGDITLASMAMNKATRDLQNAMQEMANLMQEPCEISIKVYPVKEAGV